MEDTIDGIIESWFIKLKQSIREKNNTDGNDDKNNGSNTLECNEVNATTNAISGSDRISDKSSGAGNGGESGSKTDRSTKKIPTRLYVVKEVLDSESSYLRDLKILNRVYQTAMLEEDLGIPMEQINQIFGNMDQIEKLHCTQLNMLLERIEHWHEDQKIGDIFKSLIPQYYILYKSYVCTYVKGVKMLEMYEDNYALTQLLHKKLQSAESRYLPLQSYLINPVKRPLRLGKAIEQLVKHTPETHPDYKTLMEVMNALFGLATSINRDIGLESDSQTELTTAFVLGCSVLTVVAGLGFAWLAGKGKTNQIALSG